jgi:hypothetical protein
MSLNTPTTHRFISVLSKKIETGRALNALGHMTAGLMSLFEGKTEQFRFQTYIDADKSLHMNISDNPFIVLKADNSNKIRTLRNELLARNIVFTDFTDTMIEGTFVEQHARTNQTKEADLEYFGITFFADNETAKELTKKFSLYL